MMVPTDKSPVVVTGAGIGGLTAALCLAKAGHQVVVVERNPVLREVGAGLQLSPNACHVFRQLGILEDIRSTAFEPAAVCINSGSNGTRLSRMPLAPQIEQVYGAPYLVIHRADLQQALYRAAEASERIDLRLGFSFLSAHDEPNGSVTARFKDPDSSVMSVDGQALIGADGVWSKTRSLIPGHANPAFTGRTAYRATVSAQSVPDQYLSDTGVWLGRNAHVVHYPVHGNQAFNIVVLVEEDWHEEGWSAPADKNALLARFNNWATPLKELLELPDTWLKWALCGVDGSACWQEGRIALLGDSAHGMLPFAAQGAGMAIEDAAVLADCLRPDTTDIPAALKRYEQKRKERVVRVQNMAVDNGRIYHMSGLMAVARDTVLRFSSENRLARRMSWIYEWTPPA